MAALEGTEAARTFASGHGSDHDDDLALLNAGDHIVAQRDIYGGVMKFLSQWLPKMGIETTFVDTTDYEQYAQRDPAEHEDALSGIADESFASCRMTSRKRPLSRSNTA